MKTRPLLVLLLFAVSTGVLAWVYYAVTRPPRSSADTSWTAVVADLERCGRRKHVQAAQFVYFAALADEERDSTAARLFRAMAYAQGVHEHRCAEALRRFGGSYSPPRKVVVFRGTTPDNLRRSAQFNRRLLSEQHAAAIERTVAAKNRYAARTLIRAAHGDRTQAALMQRALHDDRPAGIYYVCPECGAIYAADDCDIYCPLCLTDSRDFIAFR